MGKTLKIFLSGVLAGSLLLGYAGYTDTRRFKSEYERRVEDARKQEMPHSKFLDIEPISWKEAYLDEWLKKAGILPVYKERYLARKTIHIIEIVADCQEKLTNSDVKYVLTNKNKQVRDSAFYTLAKRRDKRILWYAARDLKVRGELYGFEKDVETLLGFRDSRAENILLSLLSQSYHKDNSSMLVWGNWSGVSGSRYRDIAAEYLTKMGSERALQIFIQKEDGDAVEIFVRKNYSKPFIREYTYDMIPLIERAMIHAAGISWWGCEFTESSADTIRRLDEKTAGAMALSRHYPCGDRINKALLGQK
jgi:hypothetical protein